MLVGGVAQPLEEDRLGVGDDDARGLEARERVRLIRLGPGADRVRHDEDLPSGRSQFQGRAIAPETCDAR